jgi:hypothetical protein
MDADERELLGSILESSNQYHNLVWDYIDKYGMTDRLKPILQGKKCWIDIKLKQWASEYELD